VIRRRDPVSEAADAARAGRLIVLPTDTVYGIGTRPDDPAATERLFDAKARPSDLELPILAATAAEARTLARFDARADRLAGACWPGALTLVLPRTGVSTGWELGGDPATVGVRVPHHPLALAVLAATGPLAVTSANRSGAPPAGTRTSRWKAWRPRSSTSRTGPRGSCAPGRWRPRRSSDFCPGKGRC